MTYKNDFIQVGSQSLISEQYSGGYLFQEDFTPTPGQTEFLLANSSSAAHPLLFINGQEQRKDTDYTIISNVLTIINAVFTLQPTDLVEIIY